VCEDVVGDVGLNFTVALVSYWRNYGYGKGINSDRGHDLLVGVIPEVHVCGEGKGEGDEACRDKQCGT
jgi:hypothetical protein